MASEHKARGGPEFEAGQFEVTPEHELKPEEPGLKATSSKGGWPRLRQWRERRVGWRRRLPSGHGASRERCQPQTLAHARRYAHALHCRIPSHHAVQARWAPPAPTSRMALARAQTARARA